MVQRHRYIENINEIIEKKLKELNLKPLKKLGEFIKKNKRFYSAPCKREKEKVFFKILIVDELAPSEAIRREIEIRKFLTDFKEKIKFPLLIKYDSQNFPYWFLSQYFEGELLGHFYNLYLSNKKYIPQIIDSLTNLHQIPENLIQKISQKKEVFLWERESFRYLKMKEYYQKEIKKEILKKINFSKIYQLFEKKKSYLEKSPLVLAHGDFTLANFVISKEKLIVTDWEQAHLDNFVYDFSHLWIQLWRYPVWQKKIIAEFLTRLPKRKIEEFKEIFRIIVISEALGELCWSINLCEKKYKAGATKAALKTINAALKGFKNLL